MKNYGELLVKAFKTCCLGAVSGVGCLLFFLWLPDFVNWLSAKLVLVAEGTIAYAVLALVPLAIVIGGLCFFTLLIFFSICNYWGTKEEITTA